MEMREDIKGLKATVDAIAKDQALGVERRASMQRSADSIYVRLDGHDRDLDRMLAWQNRADGALVLARWALGSSLVSLVAVALQVLAAVGHAVNGGIPVTEDLSRYGLGALPDAAGTGSRTVSTGPGAMKGSGRTTSPLRAHRGSVSPVARRGPGGQSLGRVSEPPAGGHRRRQPTI